MTASRLLSRESALDPSVLQGLRQLEGAVGPGLLREILETFRDTATDKIAVMRSAAQAGDRQSLERAAHSLKGSCGMVGALRMADECGSVEEAVERGACPVGQLDLGEVLGAWLYVAEEIAVLLRHEPRALPGDDGA